MRKDTASRSPNVLRVQSPETSIKRTSLLLILFMLLMILHVYLGTAASPGTWRAMSKGTVTKEWAKKHHGAWDGEEA